MHRSASAAALLLCGLMALTAMPALAAEPSPAASPAASGTAAGVPLEGTTWQLTNLRLSGAYAPIPPGASATLFLKDGHAGGTGGCNEWSAPYTLAGDKLTFGAITPTLRLCEGAGGLVETYYLADLPAVAHWAILGDTLTLSADDGQPVVAYTVQPTLDPMGTWTVTSYADGAGALVSVDDGSVTVVVDATSVSGTAGCNGFNGPWTLDGGTLMIGPLASTKIACGPAEVMARESAVMADLEASTALRTGTDGDIELLDQTGAVRLVMASSSTTAEPSGSPSV